LVWCLRVGRAPLWEPEYSSKSYPIFLRPVIRSIVVCLLAVLLGLFIWARLFKDSDPVEPPKKKLIEADSIREKADSESVYRIPFYQGRDSLRFLLDSLLAK